MNKEDYIIVINGAEAEETTEESIYSNIKEEAATLPEAMELAWQGMLGIFIVAITIIVVASLLNLVTSKKGKKKEEQ